MFIVKADISLEVGVTPGFDPGVAAISINGLRGYKIVSMKKNGIDLDPTDFFWDYQTGILRFQAPLPAANDVYLVTSSPIVSTLVDDSYYHLIDSSYFIRGIAIPNVGNNNPNKYALDQVNSLISKYEEQVLVSLLGRDLYHLLLTEDSDRMIDLMYGDLSSKTDWNGILFRLTSLIADYVYYFYQENNSSQTTGIAVKRPKSEAGVTVAPLEKMVNAWNDFSKKSRSLRNYLDTYSDIYPEAIGVTEDNWTFFQSINMFGL